MKNIVKLALCSAAIFPLMSSGQSINIVQPDNTGPFHSLVSAMFTDQSSLYSPEAAPMGYSDFYFTTDGTVGNFIAPAAPFSSLGTDYYFQLMGSNPGSFFLPKDEGEIKIGYFGNENWDINNLSVKDDTSTVQILFTYSDNPGPTPVTTPPETATITVAPQFPSASVVFEHTNPHSGTTTQGNTARFKFFQGYELTGKPLNLYIVSIDDRENDLVDFDDGFFLLQVVPEPSQVAIMSVLGLGALLLVRRRFKSKK